jgi:hypothetical protein
MSRVLRSVAGATASPAFAGVNVNPVGAGRVSGIALTVTVTGAAA